MKIVPTSFPPHTIALVRVDFNVPLDSAGIILDASRITNHIPTLSLLKRSGCKIVLLAHLGKPKGNYKAELSFVPLLPQLEKLLQEKLHLQSLDHYQPTSEITLLENIRFWPGEEENEADFSQKLASLGTVYINDAFSVSHRSHASTVGVTAYLPSFAGLALQKEYTSLGAIFQDPKHPITLIVGGKKVSDKIGVLEHLLPKVDNVLVGGACANVFYRAQGKEIGQSYLETSMIETCQALLTQYPAKISLPIDFQEANGVYLDIGKQTIKHFQSIIAKSHTVIWAGPMGKYEEAPFGQGTIALLKAITKPHVQLSVVGGGDTIAALQKEAALQKVSLVSLGGGAMLEFLAKEHLPGTDCLVV